MKLETPFIKLPGLFDADRLREEVEAIPASAWVSHPDQFNGNSALRLITVGGGENDSVGGVMAPTEHLKTMPYVQQVLASFGVVWSRSRLMRLAPGARVPPHADIKYHWRNRTRLHVPITTHPDVRFHCGGESVHMGEGESWIFDNWRTHSVENQSDVLRVHLVADTTGGARFWDVAHAAARKPQPPYALPFQPDARPTLLLEQHNTWRVMPPGEIDDILNDLMGEAVSEQEGDKGRKVLYRLWRVLEGFRQDWRGLWSLFADTDAGLQRYRERLDLALRDVGSAGAAVRCRSNGVLIGHVFADQIGAFALNPEDAAVRPIGRTVTVGRATPVQA